MTYFVGWFVSQAAKEYIYIHKDFSVIYHISYSEQMRYMLRKSHVFIQTVKRREHSNNLIFLIDLYYDIPCVTQGFSSNYRQHLKVIHIKLVLGAKLFYD